MYTDALPLAEKDMGITLSMHSQEKNQEKGNRVSYTGYAFPPKPKESSHAQGEVLQVTGCFYTPQNKPSTLRPCMTTPQPAIRLISQSTAKTRMGTSNSSVLCRKGRALYPRNVM